MAGDKKDLGEVDVCCVCEEMRQAIRAVRRRPGDLDAALFLAETLERHLVEQAVELITAAYMTAREPN